jgi:F-type H+-transporting ATPase subunit b
MRGVWLAAGLILVAVVLTRGAAGFAADPPGHDATAPGAAGAGHEGGEHAPRNPFESALDLTIWTAVVFLLLLIVLRLFAWKPILQGLQKREQFIHEALAKAQAEREAAERLRADLQAQLDQAHDTARQIHDEARRTAQQNVEEMIAKGRAEIQADRDRLLRELEMEKDQALQELWNRTAALAAEVSSKAVRRNLTPEDHRRLVDEALAELREAGTEWQRQKGSSIPVRPTH